MDSHTPNNFQALYPLSPKKFSKKILEKIGPIIFVSIGITFPIFVYEFTLVSDGSQGKIIGYAVFLITTLLFVLTLAYSLYVKAYIRSYFYNGGDDFLTIKKGVFAPSEIHVQYQKIQDVYVDQDILDRVMGLYDVHIASATAMSGIEAHIDGVDQATAEGLKNFIFNKMKGGKSVDASATVNHQEAPIRVNLVEEISSATYPISPVWVWLVFIQSIFVALWMTFVVALFIFSPGKNGKLSIAEMFEFHMNTLILPITGIFVLFFLGNLIYQLLWKKEFSFSLLPEYISMKRGIISIEEKSLPYKTIQDVTVKQGILERMFGLSTVYIQNAAAQFIPAGRKQQVSTFSGMIIPGQPIEKGNFLAQTIKTILLSKNSGQTGL